MLKIQVKVERRAIVDGNEDLKIHLKKTLAKPKAVLMLEVLSSFSALVGSVELTLPLVYRQSCGYFASSSSSFHSKPNLTRMK